jgi:hypothetical protein
MLLDAGHILHILHELLVHLACFALRYGLHKLLQGSLVHALATFSTGSSTIGHTA